MIVFIAGMPRSGSTFSFNVARCLLETRGWLYQEPTDSVLTALDSAGEATHLLVKGHNADQTTLGLIKVGAIKTICTVRKPEDAIASWMTTFGFGLKESVDAMEAWLQMFDIIRSHVLIVHFDDIDREPELAAWKIARYVCDDADEVAAKEIGAKFTKEKVKTLSARIEAGNGDIEDIGFSFYDKKTFFHRRHVLSIDSIEAVNRIGREQVLSIRQALARWCDAEGNLRFS